MSFPKYPKYKASGVEWLGDVPEGWEVCAIKRIIQKVESGTSVNASDEPAVNGKLGVLKTSCVYTGIFDPEENKTVVDEEIDRVSCPLKVGTLIVSRMNTPDLIGAAGLVTQSRDNLFLPDRLWQVSFLNTDPSYVYYWTLTSLYRGQVKAVCTGTSSSMKNLGQDQFGNFSFASPPYSEQSIIAAFLDRETTKIDELVAEQKRLMELLKEKRQAVISHAVTKGLDPNAKMKPSGVEWLGDVPEHWEVGPVKRFFTSLNPLRVPLSGEERSGRSGDYPYYGASGIIDYIDEYIFDEDLVLVSEDGANLVNRVTPIAFVATRKYWVNNHAHILKPFDQNCIFWAARLESIDLAPFITGSAQPKLTSEALNALIISASPNASERLAIQCHIESEAAKFDTLTAEAQRAIDLLQERRTALISAAVTGQIDVRNINTKETA